MTNSQLQCAYDVFSSFSIPSGNVYVDSSEVTAAVHSSPVRDGVVEVACFMVEHAKAAVSAIAMTRWNIEFWSTRSHSITESVDYHVDNDEGERLASGSVLIPAFGIVLYVGPLEGEVGGTYFNDPIDSISADPRVFTKPHFSSVQRTNGRAVEFKPGRMVVFDGRHPHCVIPFRSELNKPRVSVLCNLWPIGSRVTLT